MKKIFWSTILLAVCVSTNAQHKMKVLQSNGKITEFNVADVTKVYFEESSSEDISEADIMGKWLCVQSTDPDENDTQMRFREGESITLLSDNRLLRDDDTEEDKYENGTWSGSHWSLEGNTLYLMEEDKNDDHSVGTITVDGDVMTYSYVYKNWHGSSHYWEKFGPFEAKFKKQ